MRSFVSFALVGAVSIWAICAPAPAAGSVAPGAIPDMTTHHITAPIISETEAPPVKTPYPDPALAPVQVKEAFATAARTHRKILLDFGGNWCPDCQMLAGVFALPDVALWLNKYFVIVPVNVERLKANMGIAQSYGATITAIPAVLVLTPHHKLLNPDGLLALGDARTMSPQAVVTLLAEWANRQ